MLDSAEINACVVRPVVKTGVCLDPIRQLPTKELFVTSGLIELLNSDESLLAAVLSHEISVSSGLTSHVSQTSI